MRSSSIGVGPKCTSGCPLKNRKGDDAGGVMRRQSTLEQHSHKPRNTRSHQALGEVGEERSAC